MSLIQDRRALFARVAIFALTLAMAILVMRGEIGWLRRADESIRDGLIRAQALSIQEQRVVIVDIDEESLRRLGPWPWPRARIADLVEILLGTYRVKAVGLDMVFSEPRDHVGDARLEALATTSRLVLAQVFDYQSRYPALAQGRLMGGEAGDQDEGAVSAYGYLGNHFGKSPSLCGGNIGYLPEADGVVRKIPYRTRYNGLSYRGLAESLVACGAGRSGGETLSTPVIHPDGLWRLPFHYRSDAYTVIPAYEVLQENIEGRQLESRLVIVGSSALSLGDRVATPLEPLTPGFMVHAAAISALLDYQGGTLHPVRSGGEITLAWTGLTVSVAMLLVGVISALRSMLMLLVMTAGWFGIVWLATVNQWFTPILPPLVAYAILLCVLVPYEWWREQLQNRRLVRTFSHYVAQPVLDELLRQNLAHSLEPRLREITVLIADMEGYTKATSSLSLDDAAQLTKDVLDCLTRPVLNWRGTLDKYSGDGLVVFWGAPLAEPAQADIAVNAALDILAEIEKFNEGRAKQGLAPVRVRIGIESGDALVGDLGTSFRSTYTAVGDCINFASRLESAARHLDSSIVIGPVANGKLRAHLTRSLGEIGLRGIETRVEVFAPERSLLAVESEFRLT